MHKCDLLRSECASLSSLSMTSRSALMVSTSSINWVNCCTTGDPLREAMGLDDGSALSMSAWEKSGWHEGGKQRRNYLHLTLIGCLTATLQNQQLVLLFMCTFPPLFLVVASLTVITVCVTDCHHSTFH